MRVHDFLDRRVRAGADVVAIEDATRSISYGSLRADVTALAERLAAAGVGAGDRFAVLGRNSIEFVTCYLAASVLEAVVVPLNNRLSVSELEYIVADSGAVVVLADGAMADRAAALGATLAGSGDLPVGDVLGGWSTLRPEPRAPAGEGDGRRRDEDATVVQMYTSGTTGLPKGALLTHRNLTSLTLSWLPEMTLEAGRSRFLQVTPLFHVGALLMVLSNLAAGSTLVLLPEFAPGPAAEALAHRRVSTALFVPAMIRLLLDEPAVAGQDFPDLDRIAYGASPIAAALLRDAMETFGCDFVQGYGLTETAGVLTSLRPRDHHAVAGRPARLESAGRAVSCCEVRVVDADDRPVEPGETGELVARGTNVTPGYWNLPDATAEAFRTGWFHTGDAATIDADGFVTIVDRVKDMIIVGGENVYPREVELCLDASPSVVESAVIGVPHDVWGEQVVALVVRTPHAQITDRELIAHARARLARFKCPTRVDFVEDLPRNAAGKVRKAELRDPFWSGRSRRV